MNETAAANASICKALGLDPNSVREITISCRTETPPAVTVSFVVLDAGRLAETIGQYDLVKRSAR